MREFLAKQGPWLQVARLPAYAPELNPAQGLWANLKGRELANRCKGTIGHPGQRRIQWRTVASGRLVSATRTRTADRGVGPARSCR
jgi:transposase